MKLKYLILFFFILLAGCVVQYTPELTEKDELMVIRGSVTDQPGKFTVSVSKTIPFWRDRVGKPQKGCEVWISDNEGRDDTLKESRTGIYETDPGTFTGVKGRIYTLHVKILTPEGYRNYESRPVRMIPAPPIDKIWYEKKIFTGINKSSQGCQIYLDTHDPENSCKYYKWDFTETWQIRLPFNVPNRNCWVTNNSTEILIKSAELSDDGRIIRYPIKTIPDPGDRLKVRYSILVNQYSLNEDEYLYWVRLQNVMNQVGGLYDIIPSSVPSNIYCVEDEFEKVLGYFSVSSVQSRRFFINEQFPGSNNLFTECMANDTMEVHGTEIVEGDGIWVWEIWRYTDSIPVKRIYTLNKGCADCTFRGTNIRPDFWEDN